MNRGLLTGFGKGVRGRSATRAIVNFFSSGGAVSGTVVTGTAVNNARSVLGGALVANALRTVVEIVGPGECAFLSAFAADATPRTIRLRVWVDGRVVFDSTSGAIATSGHGVLAAGCAPISGNGTSVQQAVPIRWNQSMRAEVASSLTETDKVGVAYSALAEQV